MKRTAYATFAITVEADQDTPESAIPEMIDQAAMAVAELVDWGWDSGIRPR